MTRLLFSVLIGCFPLWAPAAGVDSEPVATEEQLASDLALLRELATANEFCVSRRSQDNLLIERFGIGRPSRSTSRRILAARDRYLSMYDRLAPKVERAFQRRTRELGAAALEAILLSAKFLNVGHKLVLDTYRARTDARDSDVQSPEERAAERETSRRLDELIDREIMRGQSSRS